MLYEMMCLMSDDGSRPSADASAPTGDPSLECMDGDQSDGGHIHLLVVSV